MDAGGARWLASNDSQFSIALGKAYKVIEAKALKGEYSAVLPKLRAEAMAHIKEHLTRSGYTIRVGTIWLKNRGRLIVSW